MIRYGFIFAPRAGKEEENQASPATWHPTLANALPREPVQAGNRIASKVSWQAYGPMQKLAASLGKEKDRLRPGLADWWVN